MEYIKPQHKKTNSDACPDLHKPKEYNLKRAQCKLKRENKDKINSDIGGSGGILQLPLTNTVNLRGGSFVGKNNSKDEFSTMQIPLEKTIAEVKYVITKQTTIVKSNKGDVTAVCLNESDSSLNSSDVPQQIPHFINPDKKLITNETSGIADYSMKHTECLFHEKIILGSHMDVVRDAQFSCNLNYLITVSEDCMVKLWDIKGLKKNTLPHPNKLEPCFSYRGHTGPLFTLCVGSGLQENEHFFYTAGNEGIIRIWGIPSVDVSKYPRTNGKNYCVGLWTSHRDVIWQLVHHPIEDLLLSVSADGTVKMWKEFDISEMVDSVDKSILYIHL